VNPKKAPRANRIARMAANRFILFTFSKLTRLEIPEDLLASLGCDLFDHLDVLLDSFDAIECSYRKNYYATYYLEDSHWSV